MTTPLTVFYSYAHKDEALRDRLAAQLGSLQAEGLISAWYDRQIVAGTEWAYAIDAHLQTASIILLLISPAFMASDYCVSIEMQQAMERHRLGDAKVIPIILEPAEWHDAPFAALQCLPRGAKPVTTWDNPEDALEDVVQGVRRALEDINGIYSNGSPQRPSELLTLPETADQESKARSSQAARIDAKSRQRMLERVRARWITGLLKDSLNEAALLTLGLQEQPDAVANPWSFALQEMHQPARPLRLGTRIIQAYDHAEGELLILGEPGAGKTTLLLELTRDLIERARRDETYPIPVVFNLSSWGLKQQPIAEWQVEELFVKYQVPRKLAKRWIEAEQILPLLDGLDEVASNKRVACTEALNTYKQEHGLLPMVICSRTADYLAESARVLLRTAIVIQPLTPAQIEEYLGSAKQQLAPVHDALQTDADLRELASTPLMLSVLALAYHGSTLGDLLAISSPVVRRQRIFTTYVQRMFQRRGSSADYTPEQTQHWLSWLAQQMHQHSQSEFYLEQMQLDWLPNPRARRGYHRLFVLLPVLIGMLVFGLYGTLIGCLNVGLIGYGKASGQLGELGSEYVNDLTLGLIFELIVGGLIIGLGFGLMSGLFISWLSRNDTQREMAGVVLWKWENVWQGIREVYSIPLLRGFLLGGGLLFGLGIGLVNGLVLGVVGGLFTTLFLFLVVAMFAGVLNGLSSDRLDASKLFRPNQGFWQSAQNAIRTWLIVALAVGLGIGLVGGLLLSFAGNSLLSGLVGGLVFGLVLGLFIGLLAGLENGGEACTQHIALRLMLWWAGHIPRRYVAFLDFATERILLRKVGGGYIFVHRLLQDYFATLETAAVAPAGSAA